MPQDGNNGSIMRRKFLKITGASSAALATPAVGIGAAKNKSANKHDIFEVKKNNDWSAREFIRKLQQMGIDFNSSKVGIKLSDNGKDIKEMEYSDGQEDISTRKMNWSDLEVYLNVAEQSNHDAVWMDWQWNIGSDDFGFHPWDYLSLGWSTNDYIYQARHSSSNMVWWKRGPGGAIWKFGDNGMPGSGTVSGWIGCEIGREDPEDRRVFTTYRHTWKWVEIDTISFGTGGVSIVFDDVTKAWRKGLNIQAPGSGSKT